MVVCTILGLVDDTKKVLLEARTHRDDDGLELGYRTQQSPWMVDTVCSTARRITDPRVTHR